MAIQVFLRRLKAEFEWAGYTVRLNEAGRVIVTKTLENGRLFELVTGEQGNPPSPFYHIAMGTDPLGAAFGPHQLYGRDTCPIYNNEIKNLFLASEEVVLRHNARVADK